MSTNPPPPDLLELTLGLPLTTQPPPPTTEPPNPRRRPRQAPTTTTRSVKKKLSSENDKTADDTIPPPYPWATDRACQVHEAAHLKENGHVSITGWVKCKKCEKRYEMGFDLDEEFCKIGAYILNNKQEIRHRAPAGWMSPALPECRYCNEKNAVRPEIAGEENTNWLFLFLGQMVGCCKHEDLKYFLSKNNAHRTAAKDRLVYLVYLCISKQLDPKAPFDL